MKRLILASGSPRRKELLLQAGLDFEVITSNVQERTSRIKPWEIVEDLSCLKAAAAVGQLTDVQLNESIVIGADTIVYQDGIVLGKPKDEAHAFRMLKLLSGKTHSVYTGVTLMEGTRQHSFYEHTKVWVYEMTDEEIRRYIWTKEPMDKAGAYGIQGAFAVYIKGIEGDYNNVVGLPIGRVYQELKKFIR